MLKFKKKNPSTLEGQVVKKSKLEQWQLIGVARLHSKTIK